MAFSIRSGSPKNPFMLTAATRIVLIVDDSLMEWF